MGNVWRTRAVFCALLPLLAACASGPTYDQLHANEPVVAQTMGRIYMYRGGSMFGAAIQPAIKVDGVKVGESVPGGYFYVDEPAGTYIVSTETEKEETVSVTLAAGQTVYVHFYPLPGVIVGHVIPEVMDPAKAAELIRPLHFDNGLDQDKKKSASK